MTTPSKPAMRAASFNIGDRVTFVANRLNLQTGVWENHKEVGEVYGFGANGRIAVLPDSWAREGHKTGLLKAPSELARLEKEEK